MKNITLTSLSPSDRAFDWHRQNADRVAALLGGEVGEKIFDCAENLGFSVWPSGEVRLSSAWFCRPRGCPVCQWRRSLLWKARADQALPAIYEKFPDCKFALLTITIKNCEVDALLLHPCNKLMHPCIESNASMQTKDGIN